MKRNTLLYGMALLSPLMVCHAQTERNYVQTFVYQNENRNDSICSITYYDEWGREDQKSVGGLSLNGKYLQGKVEYDNMGRPVRSWVPLPTQDLYDSNLVHNAQSTFGDDYAYVGTEYDVLGRVIRTTSPGSAYQIHPQTIQYHFNKSEDNIKRYSASVFSNGLEENGCYERGELSITTTISPDGDKAEIYTDKLGRTILDRKGTNADTYYVYDEKGQLRYVLQPMYQQEADLSKFAFQYEYDGLGRCEKKTIPGCSPILYWYDKADRVVCMQDGVLRGQGKYRFYLYDRLGRLCIQGLTSKCYEQKQFSYLERTKYGPAISNSGYAYFGNASELPLDKIEIELVNYYDDYLFISESPVFNLYASYSNILGLSWRNAYLANDKYGHAQLTGTWQKASNGEDILTTYVYDDFGRMIKQAEVGLGKNVFVKEYSYNFVGDVTQEVSEYYCYNVTHGALEPKIIATIQNKYDAPHTKLLTSSVINIRDSRNNKTMTDTIQHLTYDDFGRVIRNDRGGRKADMSYAYDQLHGWTTGVKSGGGFEQKLYRETGANHSRWDGSIAAMEWKTGEDYIRRYDYEYDGLHRLTDAEYSYSQLQKNPNGYTPLPMPVGCDNEDYSVEYSYDLNSNISSIYRQGRLSFGDGDGYDTVEDDYIERNGNQLKSYNPSSCGEPYYGNFDFVNGSSASVQYAYNANGALTRDLNKGITIEYDLLGNPKTVTLSGNRYIEYVYAADGRRLKMRHVTKRSIRLPGSNPLNPSPSSVIYVVTGDSTDYQGNLLLKNGKAGMYQFQGGYYSFNSNGVLDGCHYYIQDYQGNNRMVVNKNGTIDQITHYYPYGELMADISTNPTKQEFKYGGKELDRTYGLDLYDYHARQQDPKLGCFTSIDPLAEKYYGISPYAYCAGDPVNLVDPTGKFIMGTDNKKVEFQDGQLSSNATPTVVRVASAMLKSSIGRKMLTKMIDADYQISISISSAGKDKNGRTLLGKASIEYNTTNTGKKNSVKSASITIYENTINNASERNGLYTPEEMIGGTAVHEATHVLDPQSNRIMYPEEDDQLQDDLREANPTINEIDHYNEIEKTKQTPEIKDLLTPVWPTMP